MQLTGMWITRISHANHPNHGRWERETFISTWPILTGLKVVKLADYKCGDVIFRQSQLLWVCKLYVLRLFFQDIHEYMSAGKIGSFLLLAPSQPASSTGLSEKAPLSDLENKQINHETIYEH